MARRKRRWLWLALLGLALFGWYLYRAEDWLRLAGLVIAVFVCIAYGILFVARTTCDVITRSGLPCRHVVRGRLRGCQQHKREKRTALLALFGLRRSGARATDAGYAIMQGTQRSEPSPTAPRTGTVDKPTWERVSIVSGVIGTVATVVGTTVALIDYFVG